MKNIPSRYKKIQNESIHTWNTISPSTTNLSKQNSSQRLKKPQKTVKNTYSNIFDGILYLLK